LTILDEQVKAAGKRQIDLATHPLFHKCRWLIMWLICKGTSLPNYLNFW